MGCALAGLSNDPFFNEETVPFLPDAESLVTYYLEYPEVKEILDIHFRESDEYAARTLSPELRSAIGTDSRTLMIQNSPGRGDEALLSILWSITQKSVFTIEVAAQGLYTAFLHGASMRPEEVERLWGIQASTTIVPFMEQPLAAARDQTLRDIRELVG
jgi:hypothetical protein